MTQISPLNDAILHRTPQQFFTQAYLDDPIQFISDVRLTPDVLIKQENFYTTIERDQADFGIINLAKTDPVYYPVSTYSPIYDRVQFKAQMIKSIEDF